MLVHASVDGVSLENSGVLKLAQPEFQLSQTVSCIDLPPDIPAQDRRCIDDDDLLQTRIGARLQKGSTSREELVPRIGSSVSLRRNPLGNFSLRVLENGKKQIAFVPEMMVERTAGHAGESDDLLCRH